MIGEIHSNLIATLLTVIMIAGLMVGVALWYDSEGGMINNDSVLVISSFEECAKSGYPVMESYPRQCAVNGITYVEVITNNNFNLNNNQNSNTTLLSDEAKLQIATYTNQSCVTDEDCGIFPCHDGTCLVKECTCNWRLYNKLCLV